MVCAVHPEQAIHIIEKYIDDLPTYRYREALKNAYDINGDHDLRTLERRRKLAEKLAVSVETIENYENRAIDELAAALRTRRIITVGALDHLLVKATVYDERISKVVITGEAGQTSFVLSEKLNPNSYASLPTLQYHLPGHVKIKDLTLQVDFGFAPPLAIWAMRGRDLEIMAFGDDRIEATTNDNGVATVRWSGVREAATPIFALYWRF